MPAASKKQAKFMQAVAHSPEFAKKVGVKQSVGKEFAAADKSKTFKTGGVPADINKPKTHHTDGGVPNYSIRKFAGLKGGGMASKKLFAGAESMKEERMEKKVSPAAYKRGEKKEMEPAKFSAGGEISQKMNKQLPKGVSKQGIMPTGKQMGMLGMKSGGMAKVSPTKMVKMCKGGGIEVKGKSRGKVV